MSRLTPALDVFGLSGLERYTLPHASIPNYANVLFLSVHTRVHANKSSQRVYSKPEAQMAADGFRGVSHRVAGHRAAAVAWGRASRLKRLTFSRAPAQQGRMSGRTPGGGPESWGVHGFKNREVPIAASKALTPAPNPS